MRSYNRKSNGTENKNIINQDKDKNKDKHKLIDLRKATDPDDDTYICEYCDSRLIPYFDLSGQRVTRGKLFQCGKCGQIKDTSMKDLKKPEILTTRGDNQNIFFHQFRMDQNNPRNIPKPFDIDPGDDKQLLAGGFHIIRSRITVAGRVIREYGEQYQI